MSRRLLLALALSCAALTASPRAEPAGPLLTFNVIAVDAKGSPVRDLKTTDLRIYDDGKLMRAAFCRPLQAADPNVPPLDPGEFSNRPVRGNSQTTLVLLDLLNENLAERSMGWNEIGRTFQKLEAGRHFYLYLLTKDGVLFPVHGLPVAPGPAPPPDSDWETHVPALLDQAMRTTNRLRPQEYQVNVDARVRQSLDALQDLAADLSAQPGRKSLVWVSHGVPIAAKSVDGLFRDYTPLVQDLGTSLARAGIAVYAVDQVDRSGPSLSSTDTLEQLASLSGGQWFASDAAEQAIRQAVSEGPATYQVAYVPPLERWDGKFHKLRVAAETKGLRLRSLSGYFGDPREADPGQRFALAALGPADDPGIGLRATVAASQKVQGWMHYRVRVDAAGLQLTPGDPATGEISLTFAYFTNEWQPVTSGEIPTQLSLTADQRDRALREGVELSFDRPVSNLVRKVRLVVRDARSGAVGSLTLPLAGVARP